MSFPYFSHSQTTKAMTGMRMCTCSLYFHCYWPVGLACVFVCVCVGHFFNTCIEKTDCTGKFTCSTSLVVRMAISSNGADRSACWRSLISAIVASSPDILILDWTRFCGLLHMLPHNTFWKQSLSPLDRSVARIDMVDLHDFKRTYKKLIWSLFNILSGNFGKFVYFQRTLSSVDTVTKECMVHMFIIFWHMISLSSQQIDCNTIHYQE